MIEFGDTIQNKGTGEIGIVCGDQVDWWEVFLVNHTTTVNKSFPKFQSVKLVPQEQADAEAQADEIITDLGCEGGERDQLDRATDLEQPDPFDVLLARAQEVFGMDQVHEIASQ